MIVRRAAPEDIPALAALASRAFRAAFASTVEEAALATRDESFYAAFFPPLLDRSGAHLRIAVAASRPVGFCLVRDGHIDMLFCDPDLIGRGAGSALLTAAEADGAASLECFAANAPARRFYEERGWRLERSYRRSYLGCERAFVAYAKPRPGLPSRRGRPI